VLDPARAPAWALPWTRAVRRRHAHPGRPEAEWRDEITSPPAFQRGTPQAIIDATARTLTGDQRVTLHERDGGPWLITVITYTAETPDRGGRARRALTEARRAADDVPRRPRLGRRQLEATYSTRTVGDVEAAFATVGDLESNL
jgi:hypothetical protein